MNIHRRFLSGAIHRWIPEILTFLMAMMLLLLSVCRAAAEITSVSDLKVQGITVGISQGSAAESIVMKELSQAKLVYFNDNPSAYLAVSQGKINAFIFDYNQMRIALEQGVTGVHLLKDTLGEVVQVAVGISPVSKIPDLQNKINQFISELRTNGLLDEMYRRWVINEEGMPNLPKAEHPSQHLTIGTSGIVPPYSYFAGTELCGYDIELAYRFAAWMDADVTLKVYDYGAIIPAAATGDIDLIMANLNITPERAEVLPFSDVLYEEKLGILVKGDKGADQTAAAPAYMAYNGKRLGVLTGTLMEGIAKETFPDSEYLYLNNYPDCIAALQANKIDAFLGDEPGLKSIHAEEPSVDFIKERITSQEYSFAFRKYDSKSAALCEELNTFLAKCHADGTMQELEDIWFGADEARKVVDLSGLTGENGVVRVITTSSDVPFSYIKDGKNVGYDIDLVVRFCRDRGYELDLGDVDFSGRIPAVISGKYDFSTDMNVTPERAEEVLFSDPTSTGGVVLAVKSEDLARLSDPTGTAAATHGQANATAAQKGFWAGIAESFEKTFIRENRWELFVDGILITLILTVLSILLGTLLGFAAFMLCRKGNPVALGVTRFSIWLVQGMPMVVLLMILYYIVFGNASISGLFVAVIGFTLTFGSAVYSLLKIGVGAVDPGQYEAAWALGYSDRRTFFRIILPQALPHVMTAYKGEIVSLIKATAIVGYIAVTDLTKMGDIVRSRTYEAFFPLIAVTVIYFLLEGIFSFLVGRISNRFNPKRRSSKKILKGVKIHDPD